MHDRQPHAFLFVRAFGSSPTWKRGQTGQTPFLNAINREQSGRSSLRALDQEQPGTQPPQFGVGNRTAVECPKSGHSMAVRTRPGLRAIRVTAGAPHGALERAGRNGIEDTVANLRGGKSKVTSVPPQGAMRSIRG